MNNQNQEQLARLQAENIFLRKELQREKSKYLAVVNSKSWKLTSILRRLALYFRQPHLIKAIIFKSISIIKAEGVAGFKRRLFKKISNDYNYSTWVSEFDTLSSEDLVKIKNLGKKLNFQPKISILLPTYNSPEKYLRLAIESVLQQTYENWELCIADDCSPNPEIKSILSEYQKLDSRIKVTFRERNGHISAASNSASELATGDYIALLDHDDELREHALFCVVNELNQYPCAKLIYSDEDKIDTEGNRFNPYFKTDWNPELLLSQNYICHFTTIKKDIFDEVGGFRIGFEGAQDWDLFLRVSEKLNKSEIIHIPEILYHWRSIPGSTAMATGFKKYVYESQTKSVQEHLKRKNINALVEQVPIIDQIRVSFSTEHEPLVSIIIPTKDCHTILRTCITTLLQFTTYKNFEIIVIDNNSSKKETFEYFKELVKDSKITVIKDPTTPFNYAKINNNAVKLAKGELLCFLNNDMEISSGTWLTEMVSNAIRPEIGAVGAKLLYPNDTIQHAGVILGIGGIAGHSHKCFSKTDVGYFNRNIIPSNFSAVTAACLVVKKSIFEEVNGFDDQNLTVAFNDVDFCLKVMSKGYFNILTPYAVMYHHESLSRGHENTPEKIRRFDQESAFMKNKWSKLLENDPYYNKNLTIVTEDFALSCPPRTNQPWK